MAEKFGHSASSPGFIICFFFVVSSPPLYEPHRSRVSSLIRASLILIVLEGECALRPFDIRKTNELPSESNKGKRKEQLEFPTFLGVLPRLDRIKCRAIALKLRTINPRITRFDFWGVNYKLGHGFVAFFFQEFRQFLP